VSRKRQSRRENRTQQAERELQTVNVQKSVKREVGGICGGSAENGIERKTKEIKRKRETPLRDRTSQVQDQRVEKSREREKLQSRERGESIGGPEKS